MKRRLALIIVALLWWGVDGLARAETAIGLRFVVHSPTETTSADSRSTLRARLTGHVATLNRYYRDSGVALSAEIVAIDFTTIQAAEATEILADMSQERNGFAGLFQAADTWGADFTVAATSHLTLRGKPGCGRALAVHQTPEALADSRKALMVYNPVCGPHTLAHELGHLMGLNHGHQVDACQPGHGHISAIAPYALGFGIGNCDGKPQPGEFGTIMVGGWMKSGVGHDKARLPLFSNAALRDPRCGAQQLCGDPRIGDAARALNEHAHRYAAHEEPDVETLPMPDPALRACLRSRHRGEEIVTLHALRCPDQNIRDLTGLERLTALRELDLSGHNPLPCATLDRLAERIGLHRLKKPDNCSRHTP
ncbi:MAG: hypothetical protein HQM00_10795 [Magnetococcales bacterium]|nr:hypothetical protein [Magnetococcales bacterium]